MALKIDTKFEAKMTCASKNETRNSARVLESLKIGTLMTSFLKLEMCEPKIYRGVICHDNEEWCKIEVELTCQFKIEHSEISKNSTLMGCFWPKYLMFELKKYRGIMFYGTEYWCKIWRKTDFGFKNDRNLANFDQSTQKSQNQDFYWVL